MFIKSPYDTSYGALLNSGGIAKALISFLAANADINLNYEFSTRNHVKLVIITGYSQAEKELPMWEHPVTFKDHRDKDIVAIDLRKYVKLSNNEQPMNIMDIAKDISNVNFVLLRALLTSDFVATETGHLRNVYKNITAGYSLFLSTILNSIINLNPLEKVYIEIVLAYFANAMFVTENSIKEFDAAFINRIANTKLSVAINIHTVQVVTDNINKDARSLKELIENIKTVLSEEKAKQVDSNLLVNTLANSWFGPGASESVIMSLEHMPTWIALMYTNVGDPTFKRSRIATILDKYKRNIDSSTFTKAVELYFKEHKF